jgi:hypothetical protein
VSVRSCRYRDSCGETTSAFLTNPARAVTLAAMRRRLRCALLLGCALSISQTSAFADDPPLVGAVPTYFLPPGDRPLGVQLNEQLVTQIATFPIGSSSGAFTFEVDPTLGTVSARSKSFGPIFSERWQTLGARQASVGFSYQHVRFDSFWGHDLNSGGLHYPGWTGDGAWLLDNQVTFEITTDNTVVAMGYGLTDDLDLTVLVPFVRARISQVLSTQFRQNLVTGAPQSGSYGGTPFTFAGSSAGLGDIVLRGKWNVARRASGGISAVMDVRTPTGDRENLLGVGSPQFKPQVAAGWEIGRYSFRANLGYTFSGSWQTEGLTGESYGADPSFRLLNELTLTVPDEFNYNVGADWTPSEKVTVIGDLVGRRLRNAGRVVATQSTATILNASGTHMVTADVLRVRSGSINALLGNAGVRVNIGKTWLASASLLFPLSDDGLRSKLTPVFGLEYAF